MKEEEENLFEDLGDTNAYFERRQKKKREESKRNEDKTEEEKAEVKKSKKKKRKGKKDANQRMNDQNKVCSLCFNKNG